MSTNKHQSGLIVALTVLFGLTAACVGQDTAAELPKPQEQPQAETGQEKDKQAKSMLTSFEILRRADEKLEAINTVRYRVRSQRTDVPESSASITEGTVTMTGWNGSEPEKFRFDAFSRPEPAADPIQVTVGSNGKEFWYINHRDKKARVGSDFASLGPYRLIVRYFPVYEFVLPEPFGDELRAAKITLAGQAEVNGEPCNVISVVYQSRTQEAAWFISSKDYMPRRVDRRLEDPQGDTIDRSSIISDLEVNPTFKDDPYAFSLPEGYTLENNKSD
jgi:hypothetical protein